MRPARRLGSDPRRRRVGQGGRAARHGGERVEDFRLDYEAFSRTLPDEAFPKGADWLHVGPSGPRRLRLAVEHLAQHRGGICFMVDLDPRLLQNHLKENGAWLG